MSLMVSTGAEPKALSDLLKWEVKPGFCRNTRTYEAPSGSDLSVTIGMILGASAALSIASAAGGSNVGNGTISGLALGAQAQTGVYTLECITEATNAGVFAVFDPAGDRKEDLTVAVAYDNGEIALTLGDGSEDFDVGDSFTVTVTEAAGLLVPLDLTAVDGAQNVAAISLDAFTIADGVSGTRGLVLERGPAEVIRSQLSYPSGASADQKAAIDAQLLALGIKVLDAV